MIGKIIALAVGAAPALAIGLFLGASGSYPLAVKIGAAAGYAKGWYDANSKCREAAAAAVAEAHQRDLSAERIASARASEAATVNAQAAAASEQKATEYEHELAKNRTEADRCGLDGSDVGRLSDSEPPAVVPIPPPRLPNLSYPGQASSDHKGR